MSTKEKDETIKFLEHMTDGLYEVLWPANDDIWEMVKEEYKGKIPKEYVIYD